jgi:hypothetical protein
MTWMFGPPGSGSEPEPEGGAAAPRSHAPLPAPAPAPTPAPTPASEPRRPTRSARCVALVSFDRSATPEQLRALGETLAAFEPANPWVAGITGVEELLRGEAAEHVARRVGGVPLETHQILVHGLTPPPPGLGPIDAVGLLTAALKDHRAWVRAPDPDSIL